MIDFGTFNGAQPTTTSLPVPMTPAAETRSFGTQTSVLTNDCSDLKGSAAANKILKLRQKQLRGETVVRKDFNRFSEVSHNNDVKLCLDRDYFVKDLLPALRDAKDSVHMAMFKFDGGIFSNYVADLLIKKKQENETIKIRAIVDNYGSGALFPWGDARDTLARMREAGIEVVLNQVITNGVEHRKLFVVDGSTAFFGGSCIADKYFGNEAYWDAYEEASKSLGEEVVKEAIFNPESTRDSNGIYHPPFEVQPHMALPKNHDSAIRFRGDSVHQLQTSFLQTWLYHDRELDSARSDREIRSRYFPKTKRLFTTGQETTSLKISHGIPWGTSEMRQNLIALVNGASESLDIEIAYIMIPEFIEALQSAAQRGVKIRLITNSEKSTDTQIAWASFRSSYDSLLKTGNVQIFETKTYSHVKQFVADKRIVLTSTGNPEYNSWERGYDEIVLIDDPKLANQVISDVIERDLKPDRSTEVTCEEIKQTGFWQRVKIQFYAFIAWMLLFPARKVAPIRDMIEESLGFVSPKKSGVDISPNTLSSGVRLPTP